MKTRISIRACQHAIAITRRWDDPGIPVDLDGEDRRITDIEIRMGRWYSGGHRFTRQQQEQLTPKAKAIMEHDRALGPRRRFPFGSVSRRSRLPVASRYCFEERRD